MTEVFKLQKVASQLRFAKLAGAGMSNKLSRPNILYVFLNMKRLLVYFCLLVISTFEGYSQPKADEILTEQTIGNAIFSFVPVQRDGVTDQRFKYAQQILNDTKSAAKNTPINLNAADYWNITTAFVVLREPKANVDAAFSKAIHSDGATICSYIKLMGASGLDKIIPETFLPFYANCSQTPTTESSKIDINHYAETNKLNPDLLRVINTIYLNDTKYRVTTPVDWSKQKPLDERNQQLIDSLFNIYKTYIGRSLVGKQLESAMWLVVQHAPLAMMERYVPVIAAAVSQKQLDEVPFKMLIDRMYWLKYNYQIFGSQGAKIKVADDEIRNGVIKKYKLD